MFKKNNKPHNKINKDLQKKILKMYKFFNNYSQVGRLLNLSNNTIKRYVLKDLNSSS